MLSVSKGGFSLNSKDFVFLGFFFSSSVFLSMSFVYLWFCRSILTLFQALSRIPRRCACVRLSSFFYIEKWVRFCFAKKRCTPFHFWTKSLINRTTAVNIDQISLFVKLKNVFWESIMSVCVLVDRRKTLFISMSIFWRVSKTTNWCVRRQRNN